jgi:hypothetical protein
METTAGGRMSRKDEAKARERYEATANQPPVDPRKPVARDTPGSHTTGGAKDHQTPRDSEGPQ